MRADVFDTPRLLAAAALAFALAGCGQPNSPPTPGSAPEKPAAADPVSAERAKLSAEDRALVDAQEWCVISTDQRLGSMDAPLKLSVKGEPVFVCCKGCVRKAEADPDATLRTAAELKAKVKQPK